MAVNAVASGAADYVLVHRALHNPAGQLPREPDDRGPWGPAVDRSAGLLRPAGHDRPALQRVPPALRGHPRGDGGGGGGSPQERGPDPLVLLARPAARGRGVPVGAADQRPDLPARLRHPGRRRGLLRLHVGRARPRPSPPAGLRGRVRHGSAGAPPAPLALASRRHHGGRERRRRGGSGSASGIGPAEVDLPQVYDGFSPFVYFWMEALSAVPGRARHTVSCSTGGIDSDRPGALPVLSGGGALGNGRMHGVPQMLECYLQLSGSGGRAATGDASIGLACHSSPHYGGAVVYSAEPF